MGAEDGGKVRRGHRGRLTLRTALVLGMWALALATASAAYAINRPNVLNASGASAQDIRTLIFEVFGIMSLVLLTVWVLLAVVIVKFRHRPESEASQTAGDLRLGSCGGVIPLAIVAVLLTLTVRTTHQLSYPDPAVQVGVVAHQWWWEFDYGPQHFNTANEIDVPESQVVGVSVRSADVIHGFWIPQLTGKVQAIPGSINHDTIVALVPGSYRGECSNFCGVQRAHGLRGECRHARPVHGLAHPPSTAGRHTDRHGRRGRCAAHAHDRLRRLPHRARDHHARQLRPRPHALR